MSHSFITFRDRDIRVSDRLLVAIVSLCRHLAPQLSYQERELYESLEKHWRRIGVHWGAGIINLDLDNVLSADNSKIFSKILTSVELYIVDNIQDSDVEMEFWNSISIEQYDYSRLRADRLLDACRQLRTLVAKE